MIERSGKPAKQFIEDQDFKAFWNDADFQAMLQQDK